MAITIEMLQRWIYLGILDKDRASKATKKGHKHIHGKVFKSVNHSGITPAEYRNQHAVMRNGKLYRKSKKKGKKQNG